LYGRDFSLLGSNISFAPGVPVIVICVGLGVIAPLLVAVEAPKAFCVSTSYQPEKSRNGKCEAYLTVNSYSFVKIPNSLL
jgi:hypothetical protein